MKRLKSALLAALLLLSCAAAVSGCVKKSGGKTENASETPPAVSTYDLRRIEYSATKTPQTTNAGQVSIAAPPVTEVGTGETVAVSVKITSYLTGMTLNPSYAPVYYIADWGDGTWSYDGPYSASAQRKSAAEMKHVYKDAGTYKVKAAGLSMTTAFGDNLYGWSEEVTVSVSGRGYDYDGMIRELKPIASSNEKNVAKMFDNDVATKWKSAEAADVEASEWAGCLFKESHRLDRLEIKLSEDTESFPCNIAIEYTTDFGKTWYALPKYYYLYDYAAIAGNFKPMMYFKNPAGATLSLAMDGIVANGIRFAGKLYIQEPRTFGISEMRVYGDKQLQFYTSYGGSYDADLNNMWTIFGTAKTEPRVYGSIKGEATNQSPFRAGMAMIGSTEWLEWDGMKANWVDYPELERAYLEALIDVRYGPDGWSDYEGYIWATADAPQHLDVQNHYTYNAVYISSVRNYLLSGREKVYYSGEFQDFLEIKNRHGQSIEDKLHKAMAYQLTALEGESGILTINDPRNDGTVNGVSSNYWDNYKSFGYKSAYENTFFYSSLLAMADIEEYLGNDAEAERYKKLAEKAKTEFNKLFWDPVKGRYITGVNVDGYRADFGMTFVNFQAVAFGLADGDRARIIYDWLDGRRIVESDTSKGADIYGRFKYAARSNTLDLSTVGPPYLSWDHGGDLPPTPGAFGGYDHQMQNGGTIFYTSYYDVMARLRLDTDDAFKRFDVIMDEFHKDSLRRNQYMLFTQNGAQGMGEYVEGVIGEFPESGLVPLAYLHGFLGVNTGARGLEIRPNLPQGMEFAGVREYRYGGRSYSIQVVKGFGAPSVVKSGDSYFVKLPADKAYTITLDNRLIAK